MAWPRVMEARVRAGLGAKSSDSFACFLTSGAHNPAMAERPRSRFKSDIRIKPDAPARRSRAAKAVPRPCAVAGCGEAGDCRVPKSRENLSDYLWLCTAHARAHNESWDFFKGMDNGDIQKFREE